MIKIILVAGARPNFMKVAPVIEAFQAYEKINVVFVHTGQHYDSAMSGDLLQDLGLPEPHINLGVGSGSHATQTGRIMIAFENVCLTEDPDYVIVVGDVNSTLACALAARKLGIKVAHIEAGLRSHDMSMPEEINRLCTDAISDVLFTTDSIATANLMREGVSVNRIYFVGNTMIDTLIKHLSDALAVPLPETLRDEPYAVVTLHRTGNVDAIDSLTNAAEILTAMSKLIKIVFPMHPRTHDALVRAGILNEFSHNSQFLCSGPMSYITFIGLVARSRFVLTDSGGIQEETTVLGVPCLTMRENTERPITVECGTNTLVGTQRGTVLAAASRILNSTPMRPEPPPYWDGRAAERITEVIISHHNGGSSIAPYIDAQATFAR